MENSKLKCVNGNFQRVPIVNTERCLDIRMIVYRYHTVQYISILFVLAIPRLLDIMIFQYYSELSSPHEVFLWDFKVFVPFSLNGNANLSSIHTIKTTFHFSFH